MNEVEKMYENAGVYRCNMPDVDCNKNCEKCEDYNLFTAEKQLELIKWLIKYDELHADFNDDEYGFSTLNYSGKYKKDFEKSLASVINNDLWQDLTEEERKQIKEILSE